MSFDPVKEGHESSLKTVPASLSAYDPRMFGLENASSALLVLQGEESMDNVDERFSIVETFGLVAAASFASKPTGRAIIVLSLSSPSLSLRNANVHSSVSDIVFRPLARLCRDGAAYVVDGR